MSLYPLPHEQIHVHAEKRRRIGRDTNSHGPTSEVTLVDVDLVVFGRFEIKPWFPSPYVLDSLEYHQATTSSHSSNPPPAYPDPPHRPTGLSSLESHHHPHTRQKNTLLDPPKEVSRNKLPTSPVPNNTSVELTNQQGVTERSQTPDSLSSLDNGSTTQHSLHIPQKNFYPSSQSLLPSSASDLHPPSTSPPRLLPLTCSNNSINNQSILPTAPLLKLYVCDGCLKYFLSADSFRQHKIRCKMTHPPGRKVYQSGKIIIREIDGSKAKLYCQCLCLFGKLFIDHKYIFFDVEGFKFYVLTVEEKLTTTTGGGTNPMGNDIGKQKRESIMGFFSKEKISYDGYNLACIVTLPPYQKKGYGTLLIAFSYELDRFEAGKDENGLPKQEGLYLGTPERPLSTLGAKGYLSYWTAVLVRFFRTLFPPPPPRIGLSHRPHFHSNSSTIIEMTLEEISRSTRLRPDDAAFALISSGLTKFRKKKTKNNNNTSNSFDDDDQLSSSEDEQQRQEEEEESSLFSKNGTNKTNTNTNNISSKEQVIIITRDLVEQVAQRANVKSAVLDPRHILINYTNFNHHNDDDVVDNHLVVEEPEQHTNHHHSFDSSLDDDASLNDELTSSSSPPPNSTSAILE